MPPARPVILVILDGFGLSPVLEGNAIALAKTPYLDWLIAAAPKALLHAAGSEVGLDWGEMGNSEVGHLAIGTGQILMQELPRINRAIDDGSFLANTVLVEGAERVKQQNATLHIIGLASQGGVHAHLHHMLALLTFAKKHDLPKVSLHLITDGRDTQPEVIEHDLTEIEMGIKKTGGIARIATVSGRYFAMDRDQRWDRTELAYLAVTKGQGRTATSSKQAIALARDHKETDEFITPTVITAAGKPTSTIGPNDLVIATNFRSDRMRQLGSSLVLTQFDKFRRPFPIVDRFISFTSYGLESSPAVRLAFFAPPVKHQLAGVIAERGLSQVHIAETEKYAHVTYFLNGGVEQTFPNEERFLIPSPKVATYDALPAMSAGKIVDQLANRFKQNVPDLTVVNFANPDMVGHSGDLQATIQAITTVNHELGRLAKIARDAGAVLMITADHGNAEQLIHPETHEIDKEHTTNPVPFFLVPPKLEWEETHLPPATFLRFAAQPPLGVLADVAPTILDLLEIPKPAEMTGQSLKELLT